MSRSYSLGHVFATITKVNFRNDVVENFLFDEDLSGNNGLEYLPKEVVKDGYESAIEWAIDKAYEKYGVSKDALKYFLSLTIGSDGYYDEYEYDILENDHEFYFSVAWMCGN